MAHSQAQQVTLTTCTLPEGEKLQLVDTWWSFNQDIFAECVELGCIPYTSSLVRDDGHEVWYYFVHHEEVVLFHHYSDCSPLAKVRAVKEWLHDHHTRLRGTLRQ